MYIEFKPAVCAYTAGLNSMARKLWMKRECWWFHADVSCLAFATRGLPIWSGNTPKREHNGAKAELRVDDFA